MLNDFISREAAVAAIESVRRPNEPYDVLTRRNNLTVSMCNDAITDIPTADVVQVVRCGECIHRVNMEHSMDNKEICCGRMAMRVMALDDYCSHGVRIDGGEHHAD